MSPGPNVQFLLVGTEISFTLSMTGAIKYDITLMINHCIRYTVSLKILLHECALAYTILFNEEVKAIFPEDFEIFHQYSFTYGGEVEILWTEMKTENVFLLQ